MKSILVVIVCAAMACLRRPRRLRNGPYRLSSRQQAHQDHAVIMRRWKLRRVKGYRRRSCQAGGLHGSAAADLILITDIHAIT